MDVQTEGRTEGLTNKQTEGQTVRWADPHMAMRGRQKIFIFALFYRKVRQTNQLTKRLADLQSNQRTGSPSHRDAII